MPKRAERRAKLYSLTGLRSVHRVIWRKERLSFRNGSDGRVRLGRSSGKLCPAKNICCDEFMGWLVSKEPAFPRGRSGFRPGVHSASFPRPAGNLETARAAPL